MESVFYVHYFNQRLKAFWPTPRFLLAKAASTWKSRCWREVFGFPRKTHLPRFLLRGGLFGGRKFVSTVNLECTG